jgi:hypothetical protein
MRAEAQEFREETRKSFGTVFHRLNVIEATLANLKADVAILLSSVPVMNERLGGTQYLVVAPGGHAGLGSKLGGYVIAYALRR